MNDKLARTSWNHGLHLPEDIRTRTELRAGRLAMPNICKQRARRHQQQQGEQRIQAAVKVKFLLPWPAAAEVWRSQALMSGHAGHIIGLGQSWHAPRIWALKTEAGQPLRLARGFAVTWQPGQSQLITGPSACTLQRLLHRPASARDSNSPGCWG